MKCIIGAENSTILYLIANYFAFLIKISSRIPSHSPDSLELHPKRPLFLTKITPSVVRPLSLCPSLTFSIKLNIKVPNQPHQTNLITVTLDSFLNSPSANAKRPPRISLASCIFRVPGSPLGQGVGVTKVPRGAVFGLFMATWLRRRRLRGELL